jgi:alkanesulfonate monooxygenase SsuD/methylene tetrahydromethanopterin reductase-like flavin-dependent oxidoreductase (luciferase family)
MEKFRTGRLAARSWRIEDLPLAMELWGDPAVAALIDARGKLTEAQVQEKLYAEIERERSSGVQYWALFDHRNGDFVGCGGKEGKVRPKTAIHVPLLITGGAASIDTTARNRLGCIVWKSTETRAARGVTSTSEPIAGSDCE